MAFVVGVELEGVGALGAQRPQAGLRVLVEEHGVGLGRGDDRLLPVVVDRRLGGRHHARAHLHALGAERERGGHRRPVDEAARGDDRHVDLRRPRAAAAPSSTRARALEPAALATFDDQPVDARVDRLERGRASVGHHVEHGEAGVLERRGVACRAARRRRHERDALVDDELDDGRVAHEGLGDVHAERLVGEVAHLADLVPDDVELARRRLDDAHRPGVGHRARPAATGRSSPSGPARSGCRRRAAR